MCVSTVTLTLYLLALQAPAAQDPTRVLLDCSRENPVGWSELADRPGWHLTRSLATMSPAVLEGQDIVVVYYDRCDLTWNAVMTEAVLAFVRRGGGLLLMGHGGHWSDHYSTGAKYPVYQANRLAKPFGYLFELDAAKCHAQGDLRLVSGPLAEGLSGYEMESRAGVVNDLSGSSTRVVEDATGALVVAAKQYGLGRVVCWADPEGVAVSGPNEGLLRNVLAWLDPHARRPEGTGLPPDVIWPEERCAFRGVRVAVSESFCSEEQAEQLCKAVDEIGAAVEGLLGTRSEAAVTVAVLPPDTPERMPGARILEGCGLGHAFPVLLEIARAVVSGCVGPGLLPGRVSEALERYCALRALADLGYPEATAALQASRRLAAEASAEDRALAGPFAAEVDARLAPLAQATALAFVLEMADRYGSGLWDDLLLAKRRVHATPEPIDAEGFARLLEQVGVRDARVVLSGAGLEVNTHQPPHGGR